jgi:hypothetical protein
MSPHAPRTRTCPRISSGAELRIQKSRVISVDGEARLDSSASPEKNSAAETDATNQLPKKSGRQDNEGGTWEAISLALISSNGASNRPDRKRDKRGLNHRLL